MANKLIVLLFSSIVFFFTANSVEAAKPGSSCPPNTVKPYDNLIITQNTTICPGTYGIQDRNGNGVIIVGASNITIDGNGAVLDGKRDIGYGVVLNGHTGVTIKNFVITNYYYAMRIENASSVIIDSNKVSGNAVSDNTFLDINIPLSSALGGGILFNNMIESTISNNEGTGQNVGADLYSSNNNIITNNNFSFNKGWGVHLNNSDFNTVSSNRAHDVRRCSSGGCDSAGILLVMGSDNNSITSNTITNSGDGFFIGNENGLPSNNNLIEGNDGSGSPNNCFETTFSEHNTFKNNIARNCNYGFWLGFSHNSVLDGNIIENNRVDGINWEHGRFGTITGNAINSNARYGISFSLNPGSHLISKYPGSESSHDYSVSANTISNNVSRGISVNNTINSSFFNNTVEGNGINYYIDGNSTGNSAYQNNILCNSLLRTCQYNAYNSMLAGNDLLAENNWWGSTESASIANSIFDGNDDATRGLIDFEPFLQASW